MPSRRPNTRKRILAIAIDLFNQLGLSGASLQRVGHELGLTKQSIAWHFATKDVLFLAVVTPALDDLDELLAEAEAVQGTRHARRVLLEDSLDLLLRHRKTFTFIVRDVVALHHPVVSQRLRRQHQRLSVLLCSTGDSSLDHSLATAALGALHLPVVSSGHRAISSEHRAAIVDSALAVLRSSRSKR